MEHLVTIGSLLLISIMSGIAVYYPDYEDSLLERLSLVSLSIGSFGAAAYIHKLEDVPMAVVLCSVGGAVYSIEAGRKVKREKTSSPSSSPGCQHRRRATDHPG